MENYKIWLSFCTYYLLVVYIDEDLRVREKKYLHKYSTEMSKNHTFPVTIRSFVCFLLNFCCLFLWSYFFSVHSNQHPHTARFTSFVSLVKISKKLHWPNLLSIPGEETIFCFFSRVRRYTIFFPPDGIYHRIWANASWLSAGETGDRLTKSFF